MAAELPGEADAPVPAPAPAPARGKKRRSVWQRRLLIALLTLLLTVAGALVWLDTGAGHRFLIGRIARIAPESGLRIRVGDIDGSIYSKLALRDVTLSDPKGAFLTAPRVELAWWPFAWAYNRLDIDRLAIPAARLEKLPALRPTTRKGPVLPDFDIRLMQFSVGRLTIAKAITGREQMATLSGDADIRSGRAVIDMSARALTGNDALLLSLDSRPDNDRFDVDITVNAPEGGVLAAMAGLKQDANLRVQGDGTWARWNGTAVGTLDRKPALSLRLGAASGAYTLAGTVEGTAIAGNGIVQRLSAPRLSLNGEGTFQNRILDGRLSARSAAMRLDADGAVDMRNGGFDNLRIDLKLDRPAALLKNMAGQGVGAVMRLDGPMDNLSFEYLLDARRLAFGKTILSDVRAQGKGHRTGQRTDGRALLLPVRLTARQLDGHGDLIKGILRNFTLNGVLQVQGQRIVSNAMPVRADRLRGELVMIADLKSGRYDFGLTGDINGLAIPGLGIVDLRSKLRAVPGAGGSFGLSGQAQAVMRRLDNDFLRGLGGGLPQARANLSLGPDGRLMLSGLRLTAPLLTLDANGYRRPDGSFHFDGTGTHQRYGPFRLGLEGRIERPAIDVTLAHPLDAAGLRDVHVLLNPDDAGYSFTANGGSTLGAFAGNGRLLLPSGGQAVIAVDRLGVAGVTARGEIRPIDGGLNGQLAVSGPVAGTVTLKPVGGIQQIGAELTATDASFDGPTPISVRLGKLSATALLDPAGTTIDATVQGRGVQIGGMRVAQIAANAKLTDGRGKIRGSMSGQRGRLFDIQADADVTPGRVQLSAHGTLDRRAIALERPAIFTQTDDGWRLSPATVRYAGGTAQLAGQVGGEATRIEARLEKLPLSLLDIVNSDLGLGGQVTGTLSYVKPRYGIPTGSANVRMRGLTRSGLALSSRPIDLGLNAVLTNDRLAARAQVVSEGKTIGRAQALMTPLGSGNLLDRVRDAPLFAQLRYNGTADTLWRLTGIEIIDLSGPAAIGADVRGTLANPVIVGSVSSDNATIDSPVTGMRLTGVKARGRFDGSQLVISSMTGTARGGGSVTGSGSFDFAGARGVGMDLNFKATDAALLERDDIAATVTGALTIRSTGVGGTIGGDLDLNRSRFTLGRAAAVAQIPELRLIEVNRRGDEFEAPAPAAPWKLAIKARARNRLMVTGLGLDSEWRADLDIGGTVINPAIAGTAEMLRGGYEFAGRRFELREGRIRFDGQTPVNPTLAIEAEANLNGISATINVEGTGLKPIISFASVPALPQDELLSRLLFGTSITSLSAPEALQLAAAVAALQGGNGGLDPINAVRRATGLDRLRILPADPTINQGTAVAAGKYLTRKTYVELITDGQGYSATRIEYQITRWLSLLSSVSTVGRQSANVRVSKDY